MRRLCVDYKSMLFNLSPKKCGDITKISPRKCVGRPQKSPRKCVSKPQNSPRKCVNKPKSPLENVFLYSACQNFGIDYNLRFRYECQKYYFLFKSLRYLAS